MSRNGRQQPGRPRIEIGQANASPEEAAAIAAAIEQFLRDTAPPPAPAGLSRWARTGLFEGTGSGLGAASRWGDPVRWGA